MKITAIRCDRMRFPLDPPFRAAWDPVPRRHFDATLVRVATDEGVVGVGSGDTMDGFGQFESLFLGTDPLAIASQVRRIESIGFRIAGELAELGVFWLEEPLPGGDWAGPRSLRGRLRVAGGELARTPAELLAALAADALDVPHTWTNGLGLLASLHVVAGVGGGPYVEFPYDPPGWTAERRDFFLAEPVRIDAHGYLNVPRPARAPAPPEPPPRPSPPPPACRWRQRAADPPPRWRHRHAQHGPVGTIGTKPARPAVGRRAAGRRAVGRRAPVRRRPGGSRRAAGRAGPGAPCPAPAGPARRGGARRPAPGRTVSIAQLSPLERVNSRVRARAPQLIPRQTGRFRDSRICRAWALWAGR